MTYFTLNLKNFKDKTKKLHKCLDLPLRAQQSFDPVSRAAGGIWLRNGADPWCALTAPPLLASVRGVTGGAAYFPSAWGLGPLTASSAVVAVPAGVGAQHALVLQHRHLELDERHDDGRCAVRGFACA